MSIKSELEKLADKVDESGAYFFEKEITQAHQAILAEFSKMIPEERISPQYPDEEKLYMTHGYNQAIQEIKAKLHSEGL